MKDFATEGLNILAYFSQFSAAFSSKSRSGLTTVKHWHVETGRNAKTPHWRVWHYYLSQVIRLRDAMKSEVVQQASRDRAFLLNFLTYFMWQEQHWRLKFGIAHPLFCPPRLSKKKMLLHWMLSFKSHAIVALQEMRHPRKNEIGIKKTLGKQVLSSGSHQTRAHWNPVSSRSFPWC